MKKIKFLLYRLKWHLAPYINFSAPVHVDIELTSRCNLKCTFCHQQDRNYELGDMPHDMVSRIIDECAKIGVKSVKFNWRGEPLIREYVGLAIGRAKERGLFIYLNTNLSRYMPNEFLGVIALNVDVLKVSIDSVRIDDYERIRKGASMSRTLKNLFKLAEYRERYKMPRIIIARRTIKYLEEDRDFINFFKASSYTFKFDIRPAMPRNENMGKHKPTKRKYCGQPSRRLVIGWDGQVWPCCVAYDEEPVLDMGNVEDETISNIWGGDFRTALIKRLKNNDFRHLETCKNCTSKDSYK